jgi:hypothetical protein
MVDNGKKKEMGAARVVQVGPVACSGGIMSKLSLISTK